MKYVVGRVIHASYIPLTTHYTEHLVSGIWVTLNVGHRQPIIVGGELEISSTSLPKHV